MTTDEVCRLVDELKAVADQAKFLVNNVAHHGWSAPLREELQRLIEMVGSLDRRGLTR
jgi:hypothetical protein